ALIYRAYYALIRSPRFSSAGFNTSAVFGFCNTLDDLLRKENPTHIAVCFDPPHGKTFRHEKFEDYKANRDKQPEDITKAIPYIKRILEAYHIPIIEMDGYEADDVIGTLAKRAASEGMEVYMMTPDKDYGQLVGDNIFMYRPPLRGEGFEVRDAARVCERYGISDPLQVIDLLALEGDVSDNIPGCPGVGEKTARTLINDFGSVENLLEHTDRLKGKLRERIEANAEQIRMSKWLATIRTDIPIDLDPADFVRRPLDAAALSEVYRELEFKTLLARLRQQEKTDSKTVQTTVTPSADASGMGSLFDLEETSPEVTPVADDDRDYRILTSTEALAEAVAEAARHPRVGVSVYAVGDEPMTVPLSGIALSWRERQGVYIPIPADATLRSEWLALLSPLFDTKSPEIVSHDIKRAMLLLKNDGISFESDYFDTSVAHYVIDPEMRHDPAQVAGKYLSLMLSGVDADAKPGNPRKPLDEETAMARFCEEADVALRLRPVLLDEVGKREMLPLLNDVEFPLIKVLAAMEWTGVRIDPVVLKGLSAKLREQLEGMEHEAWQMAGMEFNIGSPSQVGHVLFDVMKIDPKAKKTAKGAYTTTEQVLEKYAATVPLVNLILKIRRLRKLIATYLDALPALINPRTGKIHTSYNQTVTATGRISSTNPNLQNIPIRTDDGREIRRAFIAEEGHAIMSADYSQIELRLIADLSADRDMIEAFLSGDDIHRITASKIYKVPLDEVTDDQRRHAKTANFGIIYGISAFGLAERLGISRTDAKALIDGYFATYPHIREYLEKSVVTARAQGFVTTRMGRRRYLPEINSRNAVVRGYAERNAVNAPIQGSAADIIKVAMVRIFKSMSERSMRSRMIMQVHDELIFDVAPGEEALLRELVATGMKEAYRGAVPLEISMGVAPNWLEAH
ncbi:MAG: DNA polymerase I, partial [Duncaniella sp.]|nr:DNA polymerase I [Duncaniella sp.]